jgi:hypothetical protein
MSAYQYIFKGTINHDYDLDDTARFQISFIVPTNDRRVLSDNFANSPIFKGRHPHQLIMLEHQTSAAQALENGIRLAEHDFIVYVHQDVYLPQKWDAIFCRKVTEAQTAISNAEMFGVFGVRSRNGEAIRHGHVVDRHWYLKHDDVLPIEVDSIDELLIGFRKEGFPGTDPLLGYHLYGTDIACRYREQNKAAVIINVPCFHNSGLGINLPPEFFSGIPYLKANWSKYLPLATSCGTIKS